MKRSRAFTLIEVMIAMVILVSTVYVMSDLHIRSMFRLMRERDHFLKLFTVKNCLMQQLPIIYKDFKPSKNVPEDDKTATPLTLAVELVESNPKSPLNEILGQQLALVQATGSWKNGPFDYGIRLICFAQREVPLEAKKS